VYSNATMGGLLRVFIRPARVQSCAQRVEEQANLAPKQSGILQYRSLVELEPDCREILLLAEGISWQRVRSASHIAAFASA
jgi:hypothetical protein